MDYKQFISSCSGKIFINGKLESSKTTDTMQVINPATLQEIGFIALCDDQDINNATDAAKAAQILWQAQSAQERGRLVAECAKILRDNTEILAQIMSYETGKAIKTESRVEVAVAADYFNFYASLALELKGETIPFDPKMLSFTIREPVGVVGAIIAWNVPLMLMALKLAPALVAGNSVVLKSSPEASFSVLKAIELIGSILPKGVVNIVTGAADTGKKLIANHNINKVTFTGSVESGRNVYKTAAERIIPVNLELGGKSPAIILEDADLEKTVIGMYNAMRFTRQGQSCTAASRLFIHDSLHDKFVDMLLERLSKDVIGNPMDENTDIGTIISKRQYDKIRNYIDIAENDPQLKVLYARSNLPQDENLKKGLFLKPTLITGIRNDHILCKEEIFGPVLSVLRFKEFNEVMQCANDTTFGLAAGIYTKDLNKALNFIKNIEAGFIQVNQYMVMRPSLPFGGFKNSGIGKESSLNSMLDHYTKQKTVIINIDA